jgi:hypothetical protein
MTAKKFDLGYRYDALNRGPFSDPVSFSYSYEGVDSCTGSVIDEPLDRLGGLIHFPYWPGCAQTVADDQAKSERGYWYDDLNPALRSDPEPLAYSYETDSVQLDAHRRNNPLLDPVNLWTKSTYDAVRDRTVADERVMDRDDEFPQPNAVVEALHDRQ